MSAKPYRSLSLAALGLALILYGPVAAQSVKLASKFNDWSVFVEDGAAKTICFVTSQPADVEPKGAKRGPIYLYVSAWPKDGVKAEISVKLGFPIKKASDVTVSIGTSAFKLFPKDERAFIADPTEELKLLEAMKKGTKLTVAATSERGTAITDTYSLAGISQALQALATNCP